MANEQVVRIKNPVDMFNRIFNTGKRLVNVDEAKEVILFYKKEVKYQQIIKFLKLLDDLRKEVVMLYINKRISGFEEDHLLKKIDEMKEKLL